MRHLAAKSKSNTKRAASRSTQFVAFAMVAISFAAAKRPSFWPANHDELAIRFSFNRTTLDVAGIAADQHIRLRDERLTSVRPHLERVKSWVLATRSGCATGDLDRDGLPNDLLLCDPRLNAIVVMPVPGTGSRYKPFLLNPGPLAWNDETMSPSGSCVGDFNEDGLPDVLVVYWGRTPIVFLNQGGISDFEMSFAPFELVPSNDQPQRWFSHAVTQADIDGDGHLDVIVGNFFQDNADVLDVNANSEAAVMQAGKSRAMNGGGTRLLLSASSKKRPDEPFRYVDRSQCVVDLTGRGWVLAAGAADFDSDGLPEIYLANDFGPDRILHNRSVPGEPQFALCTGIRHLTTPRSFVFGHDSFKGMGVDFADLNSDGIPDVLVSNIADEWALQESHFVWMSNGDIDAFQKGIAPYKQSSERLGLSRSGWGWDIRAADFNNDRVHEVVQATGFMLGTTNRWPELQAWATTNSALIQYAHLSPSFKPGDDISGRNPTPFYCKGSDDVYVNIASELNLEDADQPMNTRGIAIDDVDGDGLLDFVMANQWADSCFFRNTSPTENSFLSLHLILPVDDANTRFWSRPNVPGSDTPGSRAVGAVVRIRSADGYEAVSQSDGGSGHTGRGSPIVHFGLGNAVEENDVAVNWRDRSGDRHQRVLRLQPGIHTIVLGHSMKETTK